MEINDKLVQLVAKWYCDTSKRLLVAEDANWFYAVSGGLAVRVSPHPFSEQAIGLRDNVGTSEIIRGNIKRLFDVDVSELSPLSDLERTCKTNTFTGLFFTDGHSRHVLINQAYLRVIKAKSHSTMLYGLVDKGEIQNVYVTPFESDEIVAVIRPLAGKWGVRNDGDKNDDEGVNKKR